LKKKKTNQAKESCYQRLFPPREDKLRAAFRGTVEGVLDSGVGPECAEALEEALSTISPDPLFLGGTASICLAESRH
jgi:hypothetical protein